MPPGDFLELGLLIITGLAILIPISGFTARFALRPIAESIARLRESRHSADVQHLLEQRVSRMEAEFDRMAELHTSVERLADELEFQRKLALPAPDASPASAAPGAPSRS